ncbi:MAG: hypothetical protein ACFE94_03645 [Candidatus Hodarchaeota archaeon]
MNKKTKVLLYSLGFLEGPRWRNGKLFFSDAVVGKSYCVDGKGNSEVIVKMASP